MLSFLIILVKRNDRGRYSTFIQRCQGLLNMRRFQNYFGGIPSDMVVLIMILNTGTHLGLRYHMRVVFLGGLG